MDGYDWGGTVEVTDEPGIPAQGNSNPASFWRPWGRL